MLQSIEAMARVHAANLFLYYGPNDRARHELDGHSQQSLVGRGY